MGVSLEEILGLPRLLGLIQESTSGLPMEEVYSARLPGLMNISRDVIGNSGQATLTKGQRKVPKLIKYNSPPIGAPLETIAVRDWVLLAFSETITIDPITMMNLRAYESFEFQQLGAEEIGRQASLFKQKFKNIELASLTQALVLGKNYFDAAGNLLPSSSGATQTIDFGVSANHQNQLNGIIDIPWSNPNANIPYQIQNIKKQAAKDTGYIPQVALYGANVPSWIMQNQYVQAYQARNQAFRDTVVMDNAIPDGYMDIAKWVNGSTFFYEDANGTNQSLVPDDMVIFFPEPNRGWYEWWKGSMLLPTTLNILPTEAGLQGNTRMVYGMYLYAYISMAPINYSLVAGTTFFPGIKNPDVLFQADVNF